MARTWQLNVRATGDTRHAQRELRKLQRSVRGFGQGMQNIGRTMTMAITAPVAALGVIGVREAMEQRVVMMKTEAVLKSMGSTARVSAKHIVGLSESLEGYSAVEADVIQNSANVLATFSKVVSRPELFDSTMRAAVDMSAALGQDLQTTVTQLGKAMQNGAKGAGALSRNGTLAKDDIAKLQEMAKKGVPLWKQQEFILAAVNKQYKGQGKNVDPLKRLGVVLKNVAESFGELLLPALDSASKYAQRFQKWLDGLSASMRRKIGVALLLVAALGPLLTVVGSITVGIAALIPIITAVGLPVIAAVAAIGAFVAVLVVAYARSERFRGIVNKIIGVLNRNRQALLLVFGVFGVFAAGVVTAYKKSETFRKVVHAIWDLVRRLASVLRDTARAVIEFYTPIAQAMKKSKSLREALGLIKDLASAVASMFRRIANYFSDSDTAGGRLATTLTGPMRTALIWLRDNAGGIGKVIASAFTAADTKIASVLTTIRKIISAIESAIRKIDALASKIRSVAKSKDATSKVASNALGSAIPSLGAAISIGDALRSGRHSSARMTPVQHFHITTQSSDTEAVARRVAYLVKSGAVGSVA